jgi:hypothetical protein
MCMAVRNDKTDSHVRYQSTDLSALKAHPVKIARFESSRPSILHRTGIE